jgi:hypothetical protein
MVKIYKKEVTVSGRCSERILTSREQMDVLTGGGEGSSGLCRTLHRAKGNVRPATAHVDPQGDQNYSSTLSLTSALDGVAVNVTPRPLYPLGREQVAIGGPELVCTSVKNLAPTGIRSPDRPARNQPLYRLSHGCNHMTGSYIATLRC